MGFVFAIANQKGGVGKTTTAINLASCISLHRKPTLLIDLDPQGNATTGLGIDKSLLTHTIYDSFTRGTSLRDLVIPTDLSYLRIIPSNLELAGAEVELVGLEGREFLLKNSLRNIRNEYDYIFLDCPPSLGILTLNALTCANFVLIPVQCEFYAMEALTKLLKVIERVREELNQHLKVSGIILTMADLRTNLSRQVMEEIRRYFSHLVYRTVIPRNVRLGEAPSFGKPVIMYDRRSSGARSYWRLAKEVMRRVQKGSG